MAWKSWKQGFQLGISGMEGFTGVAGGPLFLGFFDTADNMAIGGWGILFGETTDFCQKV